MKAQQYVGLAKDRRSIQTIVKWSLWCGAKRKTTLRPIVRDRACANRYQVTQTMFGWSINYRPPQVRPTQACRGLGNDRDRNWDPTSTAQASFSLHDRQLKSLPASISSLPGWQLRWQGPDQTYSARKTVTTRAANAWASHDAVSTWIPVQSMHMTNVHQLVSQCYVILMG